MNIRTLYSPAKINLALNVVGKKRSLHKIESIVSFINLYDLIKIKEAYVNQGPVMKRFRAASMGRASKLRRPTSHLTIVLTTE